MTTAISRHSNRNTPPPPPSPIKEHSRAHSRSYARARARARVIIQEYRRASTPCRLQTGEAYERDCGARGPSPSSRPPPRSCRRCTPAPGLNCRVTVSDLDVGLCDGLGNTLKSRCQQPRTVTHVPLGVLWATAAAMPRRRPFSNLVHLEPFSNNSVTAEASRYLGAAVSSFEGPPVPADAPRE